MHQVYLNSIWPLLLASHFDFYTTGELWRIIQILTLALDNNVLPLPVPISSLIKIYPLRFVPTSSGTKCWSYTEPSVHLHSYGSLSLHFIVWLQLLQVPIPSIAHQYADHDSTSPGIVKRMTSKSRSLEQCLDSKGLCKINSWLLSKLLHISEKILIILVVCSVTSLCRGYRKN